MSTAKLIIIIIITTRTCGGRIRMPKHVIVHSHFPHKLAFREEVAVPHFQHQISDMARVFAQIDHELLVVPGRV